MSFEPCSTCLYYVYVSVDVSQNSSHEAVYSEIPHVTEQLIHSSPSSSNDDLNVPPPPPPPQGSVGGVGYITGGTSLVAASQAHVKSKRNMYAGERAGREGGRFTVCDAQEVGVVLGNAWCILMYIIQAPSPYIRMKWYSRVIQTIKIHKYYFDKRGPRYINIRSENKTIVY